jgi:hypothetical protein
VKTDNGDETADLNQAASVHFLVAGKGDLAPSIVQLIALVYRRKRSPDDRA